MSKSVAYVSATTRLCSEPCDTARSSSSSSPAVCAITGPVSDAAVSSGRTPNLCGDAQQGFVRTGGAAASRVAALAVVHLHHLRDPHVRAAVLKLILRGELSRVRNLLEFDDRAVARRDFCSRRPANKRAGLKDAAVLRDRLCHLASRRRETGERRVRSEARASGNSPRPRRLRRNLPHVGRPLCGIDDCGNEVLRGHEADAHLLLLPPCDDAVP